MSKSLVAVAVVAALALAVLGKKEFTIMSYPGANCTGTPNVSAVPLDDCLPIPPGHGNFSAAKFGFPREVPIATIYPDATANCTSLGQGFDVPCGRCMDSGRSDIGYHRYLCDLKQQLAHVDLRCDPMCFRCEVHAELVVGQCTPYDNGTKTVMLGSINRSLSLPEILFDGANQTCSWERDIHVYDLPCDKCVQSTYFNCTITDGVQSERRGLRKIAGSSQNAQTRPDFRHVRLPGRLHH